MAVTATGASRPPALKTCVTTFEMQTLSILPNCDVNAG
jgi:hypothetical protein